MSHIPPGAQRSDDGYYWWDGNAWQPVNQTEAAAEGPSGPLEHQWGASVVNQVDVPEMQA
jgi:hypothetical protein